MKPILEYRKPARSSPGFLEYLLTWWWWGVILLAWLMNTLWVGLLILRGPTFATASIRTYRGAQIPVVFLLPITLVLLYGLTRLRWWAAWVAMVLSAILAMNLFGVIGLLLGGASSEEVFATDPLTLVWLASILLNGIAAVLLYAHRDDFLA